MSNGDKKSMEQNPEHYIKYRKHYIKQSAIIFLISIAIVLIIVALMVINKYCVEIFKYEQVFFLFLSLIALGIRLISHYHYQNLLNDPLSGLSEEIIIYTPGRTKSLAERTAAHQRALQGYNTFFWLGLLCFLVVFFIALIPSGGNNDNDNESSVKLAESKDDGKIEIDFIQVNDVYEIAALDSGKIGGMSRVASLKRECLKTNPNTQLVMAGDFLSPSIFNTVKSGGETLGGRQMIDAMNAAGFDIAMFGNHEFDISKTQLEKRINESSFEWVASNVHRIVAEKNTKKGIAAFQKNGTDIPPYLIKTFTDQDGTVAKIGIIALTLPTKTDDTLFASFDATIVSAKKVYDEIKNSCDAVVAITHQLMEDDKKLAAAIPQLVLIMGGHEHNMQFGKVGNVVITKAHLNAKSAFIIKLGVDKNSGKTNVSYELKKLDFTVPKDYLLEIIAQRWTDTMYQYFTGSGFNPKNIIVSKGNAFNATDEAVRNHSTNFTNLIAKAMKDYCRKADLAIFNAGSIRADEFLNTPVSELDILKALPYKDSVREVEMTGKILLLTLDSALHNNNEGAFLQYSENVTRTKTKEWLLNNKPIVLTSGYRVAINNFLLKGKENNLSFLNPAKGYVKKIQEPAPASKENDIRRIVIDYIKREFK